MSKSDLEEHLLYQMTAIGLPLPTREYQAIQGRRFRFDFAWEDEGLLVEVDGGTWGGASRGRHVRGEGYRNDREKDTLAVLAGWRVVRVTGGQVRSGEAVTWIEKALSRTEEDTQD